MCIVRRLGLIPTFGGIMIVLSPTFSGWAWSLVHLGKEGIGG